MTTMPPPQTANPTPAPAAPRRAPRATFVCCVEAGGLDVQAALLAQSIRRWGGRFADAPIIAVKPRHGPPLDRRAVDTMNKMGVEVRRVCPTHGIWWYGTINKPTTLAAVEPTVDTDLIIWLDTDTLVVAEPTEFDLPDDVDFAARPAESMLGTSGEGSVNDPYWRAVCAGLGLDYDALPWVTSYPELERIRMYWQGGAYCYRAATKLSQAHLAIYLRRVDLRIASKRCGVYFYDQTSMTLAVHQLKLRHHALSPLYNFGMNKRNNEPWDRPELGDARVIHYHDSLWPDTYERFMGALRKHRGDVHDFLAEHGPLRNRLALPLRAYRRGLQKLRDFRYERYERTCTAY